ncbi:MAG TPA: glycosyltransferase family 87 protein [Candidatus Limnocylindrales bacterium]
MATTSLDPSDLRAPGPAPAGTVGSGRLPETLWPVADALRPFLGRVRPLAEDGRWLIPIALAIYVLGTTWTWNFPDWRGIPFPPVWLGFAAATLLAWRWRRGSIDPIAAAAIVTFTAMLATDVTTFWTQGARDILLYVRSADQWAHGAPVYMSVPLSAVPTDLSNYPFLYPPVTLPLFAALGAIPFPVAAGLWIGVSLALFLLACRWIGLSWRWSVAMLAWPPVAQGLFVGNVAVPLFALFAAAPWRPALLAIAPIFKLYSGIATLWLLRREHWRSLVVGVAVVALACLATLPLLGPGRWVEWIGGLRAYQTSQELLPNLYGFGPARYIPLVVALAVALVVTVLALRARGRREQLARLGVATVVGSPSLFSHGFLVALPAMLRLDTPWFWLAFGLTCCAPGPAWFIALAIVVWSWFEPALRKPRRPDAFHPLATAPGPWPGALAAKRQGTV